MYFQFENAPVVEQSERPQKTNFFTDVGVKINFGGSRAPGQDYNTSRSNKPKTIADMKDIFDLDLPNSVIITSRTSEAGGNPLYSGSGQSADNPLNEGESNNNNGDLDSDNDGVPDSRDQEQDIKVLEQGERLSLVGFGSFSIGKRSARTGR